MLYVLVVVGCFWDVFIFTSDFFLRASRHIKSYQSSCWIAKHGFVVACVFLMYCFLFSQWPISRTVEELIEWDSETMQTTKSSIIHGMESTHIIASTLSENVIQFYILGGGRAFQTKIVQYIFHFHGYRNDSFSPLMQLLEPCCPHVLPRWYAPTVGNGRHNSPAKELQKRMQLALLVTVCGSSIRDLVCMQGRASHNQIWNWLLFLVLFIFTYM